MFNQSNNSLKFEPVHIDRLKLLSCLIVSRKVDFRCCSQQMGGGPEYQQKIRQRPICYNRFKLLLYVE